MKTLIPLTPSNLNADGERVRALPFAARHLVRRHGLRPSAARIVAECLYNTEVR